MEMHADIFRLLGDSIRRNRPENEDWIFLRGNCDSISIPTGEAILRKHNVTNMEHHPYCPDLAPSDCFLFFVSTEMGIKRVAIQEC